MFPPPNPLFQQRQRIMGAPRNVAYMPGTGPSTGRTAQRLAGSFGGLNEFYALQDRSRPAFADPRGIYGLGPSAQEEGRRSTQAGLVYNPYLAAYMPDTMYTRTMGSRGMGTVPNVQPQPPQMTDQQMEWAQKAQAGKSGSDVLGKMGEKMAGFSRPPGMLGSAFSVAQTAANAASSRVPEFSFSQGSNPYSGTRAQNFQNMLDAGGDFAQIRQDYNREALGTGYSMGNRRTMGRISYNPYTNTLGREQLQGQIDAKRAAEMAAKGEGAVQRFNAQGAQANISPEMERGGFRQTSGSAFKVNPYGTATATFGERKGPGMVKDELTGKMVPISQAVADMKAVQATKGINPETGAPLEEKETKKAQEGFFASRGKGGKSKVA